MISTQDLLRRLQDQRWVHRSSESNSNPIPLRRIARLVLAESKGVFGVHSYLKNEDRRVLEDVIFPYFVDDGTCNEVLFVGCSWCTKGYSKRFDKKKYWTIDKWPWKKRYGAKQHIIDELQNLRRHFKLGTLDLIICNSVFGWGLDARADVEQAFRACLDCLHKDGVLVVGWDDIDNQRPFALEECQSLRAFKPFIFPPLGAAKYVTATPYHHTYTFYIKQ